MSKNNEKLVDEWLKINLQLHNSLKTLKELEEEQKNKKKMIDDSTPKVEFEKILADSLTKYENCLAEIKHTKKIAENLRKVICEQN